MIKISAYELNKQKEQVKMAAFADELEKLGAVGMLAKITKMFGFKVNDWKESLIACIKLLNENV